MWKEGDVLWMRGDGEEREGMLDITNTLGFDLDVLYDAHPHGMA